MTGIAEIEHGVTKTTFNPNAGLFDSLMEGATVIQTASLEQDKMSLIGVPMMITRVTYRPKAVKTERGFVSVEAVIGDVPHIEQAIRRGWIPGVERLADFPFTPEELIVFNDGSTGIRRQLTMLLQSARKLDIGPYEPAGNTAGVDPAFDRDWSEWNVFATSSKQNIDVDSQGNTVQIDVPDFTDLRIFATHGLRVSNYTAAGVGDATTFYLA